MTDNDINNMCF